MKNKLKPTDDMPSLEQLVFKARGLGQELHLRTDELNRVLTEVETVLLSMNVGVHAVVRLPPREGYEAAIGFGKIDKHWRLTYEALYVGKDCWEVSPLVNASREIRVDAIDYLTALVEAIVARAEQEVLMVCNAVRSATFFINEFRKVMSEKA